MDVNDNFTDLLTKGRLLRLKPYFHGKNALSMDAFIHAFTETSPNGTAALLNPAHKEDTLVLFRRLIVLYRQIDCYGTGVTWDALSEYVIRNHSTKTMTDTTVGVPSVIYRENESLVVPVNEELPTGRITCVKWVPELQMMFISWDSSAVLHIFNHIGRLIARIHAHAPSHAGVSSSSVSIMNAKKAELQAEKFRASFDMSQRPTIIDSEMFNNSDANHRSTFFLDETKANGDKIDRSIDVKEILTSADKQSIAADAERQTAEINAQEVKWANSIIAQKSTMIPGERMKAAITIANAHATALHKKTKILKELGSVLGTDLDPSNQKKGSSTRDQDASDGMKGGSTAFGSHRPRSASTTNSRSNSQREISRNRPSTAGSSRPSEEDIAESEISNGVWDAETLKARLSLLDAAVSAVTHERSTDRRLRRNFAIERATARAVLLAHPAGLSQRHAERLSKISLKDLSTAGPKMYSLLGIESVGSALWAKTGQMLRQGDTADTWSARVSASGASDVESNGALAAVRALKPQPAHSAAAVAFDPGPTGRVRDFGYIVQNIPRFANARFSKRAIGTIEQSAADKEAQSSSELVPAAVMHDNPETRQHVVDVAELLKQREREQNSTFPDVLSRFHALSATKGTATDVSLLAVEYCMPVSRTHAASAKSWAAMPASAVRHLIAVSSTDLVITLWQPRNFAFAGTIHILLPQDRLLWSSAGNVLLSCNSLVGPISAWDVLSGSKVASLSYATIPKSVRPAGDSAPFSAKTDSDDDSEADTDLEEAEEGSDEVFRRRNDVKGPRKLGKRKTAESAVPPSSVAVTCLADCSGLGFLLSGAVDGSISLWRYRADGDSGIGDYAGIRGKWPPHPPRFDGRLSGHSGAVLHMAVHDTFFQARLVSCGVGSEVLVWDLNHRTLLARMRAGVGVPISALCLCYPASGGVSSCETASMGSNTTSSSSSASKPLVIIADESNKLRFFKLATNDGASQLDLVDSFTVPNLPSSSIQAVLAPAPHPHLILAGRRLQLLRPEQPPPELMRRALAENSSELDALPVKQSHLRLGSAGARGHAVAHSKRGRHERGLLRGFHLKDAPRHKDGSGDEFSSSEEEDDTALLLGASAGSGDEFLRTDGGDPIPVGLVYLSASARFLLAEGFGALVFSARRNVLEGSFPRLLPQSVVSVAAVGDGHMALLGDSGGNTVLLSTHDGRALARTNHPHTAEVTAIVVCEEDGLFFSAGWDKSIRCFALPSKRAGPAADPLGQHILPLVRLVENAHDADISCMAVSRALGLLATGSIDGVIRVWNLCTFDLLSELSGHSGAVTALSFPSPCVLPLLVSSDDAGSVLLWAVQGSRHPGYLLVGLLNRDHASGPPAPSLDIVDLAALRQSSVSAGQPKRARPHPLLSRLKAAGLATANGPGVNGDTPSESGKGTLEEGLLVEVPAELIENPATAPFIPIAGDASLQGLLLKKQLAREKERKGNALVDNLRHIVGLAASSNAARNSMLNQSFRSPTASKSPGGTQDLPSASPTTEGGFPTDVSSNPSGSATDLQALQAIQQLMVPVPVTSLACVARLEPGYDPHPTETDYLAPIVFKVFTGDARGAIKHWDLSSLLHRFMKSGKNGVGNIPPAAWACNKPSWVPMQNKHRVYPLRFIETADPIARFAELERARLLKVLRAHAKPRPPVSSDAAESRELQKKLQKQRESLAGETGRLALRGIQQARESAAQRPVFLSQWERERGLDRQQQEKAQLKVQQQQVDSIPSLTSTLSSDHTDGTLTARLLRSIESNESRSSEGSSSINENQASEKSGVSLTSGLLKQKQAGHLSASQVTEKVLTAIHHANHHDAVKGMGHLPPQLQMQMQMQQQMQLGRSTSPPNNIWKNNSSPTKPEGFESMTSDTNSALLLDEDHLPSGTIRRNGLLYPDSPSVLGSILYCLPPAAARSVPLLAALVRPPSFAAATEHVGLAFTAIPAVDAQRSNDAPTSPAGSIQSPSPTHSYAPSGKSLALGPLSLSAKSQTLVSGNNLSVAPTLSLGIKSSRAMSTHSLSRAPSQQSMSVPSVSGLYGPPSERERERKSVLSLTTSLSTQIGLSPILEQNEQTFTPQLMLSSEVQEEIWFDFSSSHPSVAGPPGGSTGLVNGLLPQLQAAAVNEGLRRGWTKPANVRNSADSGRLLAIDDIRVEPQVPVAAWVASRTRGDIFPQVYWTAHLDAINSLSVIQEPPTVCSTSMDGSARLWTLNGLIVGVITAPEANLELERALEAADKVISENADGQNSVVRKLRPPKLHTRDSAPWQFVPDDAAAAEALRAQSAALWTRFAQPHGTNSNINNRRVSVSSPGGQLSPLALPHLNTTQLGASLLSGATPTSAISTQRSLDVTTVGLLGEQKVEKKSEPEKVSDPLAGVLAIGRRLSMHQAGATAASQEDLERKLEQERQMEEELVQELQVQMGGNPQEEADALARAVEAMGADILRAEAGLEAESGAETGVPVGSATLELDLALLRAIDSVGYVETEASRLERDVARVRKQQLSRVASLMGTSSSLGNTLSNTAGPLPLPRNSSAGEKKVREEGEEAGNSQNPSLPQSLPPTFTNRNYPNLASHMKDASNRTAKAKARASKRGSALQIRDSIDRAQRALAELRRPSSAKAKLQEKVGADSGAAGDEDKENVGRGHGNVFLSRVANQPQANLPHMPSGEARTTAYKSYNPPPRPAASISTSSSSALPKKPPTSSSKPKQKKKKKKGVNVEAQDALSQLIDKDEDAGKCSDDEIEVTDCKVTDSELDGFANSENESSVSVEMEEVAPASSEATIPLDNSSNSPRKSPMKSSSSDGDANVVGFLTVPPDPETKPLAEENPAQALISRFLTRPSSAPAAKEPVLDPILSEGKGVDLGVPSLRGGSGNPLLDALARKRAQQAQRARLEAERKARAELGPLDESVEAKEDCDDDIEKSPLPDGSPLVTAPPAAAPVATPAAVEADEKQVEDDDGFKTALRSSHAVVRKSLPVTVAALPVEIEVEVESKDEEPAPAPLLSLPTPKNEVQIVQTPRYLINPSTESGLTPTLSSAPTTDLHGASVASTSRPTSASVLGQHARARPVSSAFRRTSVTDLGTVPEKIAAVSSDVVAPRMLRISKEAATAGVMLDEALAAISSVDGPDVTKESLSPTKGKVPDVPLPLVAVSTVYSTAADRLRLERERQQLVPPNEQSEVEASAPPQQPERTLVKLRTRVRSAQAAIASNVPVAVRAVSRSAIQSLLSSAEEVERQQRAEADKKRKDAAALRARSRAKAFEDSINNSTKVKQKAELTLQPIGTAVLAFEPKSVKTPQAAVTSQLTAVTSNVTAAASSSSNAISKTVAVPVKTMSFSLAPPAPVQSQSTTNSAGELNVSGLVSPPEEPAEHPADRIMLPFRDYSPPTAFGVYTRAQVERLRSIWAGLSKNPNGCGEIEDVLNSSLFSASTLRVTKAIFATIDADNSGDISLSELAKVTFPLARGDTLRAILKYISFLDARERATAAVQAQKQKLAASHTQALQKGVGMASTVASASTVRSRRSKGPVLFGGISVDPQADDGFVARLDHMHPVAVAKLEKSLQRAEFDPGSVVRDIGGARTTSEAAAILITKNIK